MGSLRHRAGVVVLACLLTGSAAPAIARTRTQSLTFTTGQFVVNCTSSGQRCSPPKRLTFRLALAGTLTSIKYTTAATHCSALVLRVFRDGRQIAKTGRLEAGESTERLVTRIGLRR